jgi:xylulose-5-phosphate/fructose-6-phosphate phosphoketolase
MMSSAEQQYQNELEQLRIYQRAANYLAAAQIYLKENVLLKEPLKVEHLKPRLLGHWGTCPGINLIYAHLDRLIQQYNLDMFLVTGPGHGAPAILANLYLEGTLREFYPELTHDVEGLTKFIRSFSWPGGFASHLNPLVPGTIHEGGELGYALSTAFGAVMDNPDLIVACLVGDGEAETGPTAAGWHSSKFLDPVESGAVLPIVHINGYKISNPTIYGTMSDQELLQLFTGYGYRPKIVKSPAPNSPGLDLELLAAMEWAYHEIKLIQETARQGDKIQKPQWPVILLRSLKGWTGIKEINGEPIEGSYRSHQVPAKDLLTNPDSLKLVENWLRSYKPQELFTNEGRPVDAILNHCPKGNRRMGMNPHTYGGKIRRDLQPQNIFDYEVVPARVGPEIQRGKKRISNIKSLARYVSKVIKDNPKDFRIFSPDELESNLLDVFGVTHRNYQWPVEAHNEKITQDDGRVLEILSEHTCQGWMQGYVLTGRYALFPSYEAFLGIVATMMDQFAKFIKTSEEVSWRLPVPSLNYLATSTHWRQEHNGFSHQNPGFINNLLNKKGEMVRIYLPPDANCLISTIDHCFSSTNKVNYVISNKQEMPQWLSMEEAIAHCRAGVSIWKWASTDEGIDPDVVLVGLGDEPTVEVMAATSLLRKEIPLLRVRVVNVTDLLVLEKETRHPHGIPQELFESIFTKDRPLIFNFHGYPTVLQQLLFARADDHRLFIHGYREEGTTTTPFDIAIRNGTSRYQIAMEAIKLAALRNPSVAVSAMELISKYEYLIRAHRDYIQKYGKDPEEITNWEWDL